MKIEFNFLLVENEELAKSVQFLKELIANETEVLLRCLNMESIHQMEAALREVVNSFCGAVSLNLHPVMVEVPPLEIGKKSVSTPLPVSNEDEQIQSEIDGLNDKFEALMYEYKTSNRSEIRK